MTDGPAPNLLSALVLAFRATERWLKEGYIDIPELDPDSVELEKAFTPVFQRKGWGFSADERKNERLLGYEFNKSHIEKPVLLAKENARAFDLLVQRVQANLILGFPMGTSLTAFAHEVIGGNLTRPAQRANRPPVVERNTLLISIVERVNEQFGIPRASDENLFDPSGRLLVYGSNIAWASFEIAEVQAYGKALSPEQVAKIVRNDTDARLLAQKHPYLHLPKPKGDGVLGNALAGIMNVPDAREEIIIEAALRTFTTP